jgi:adenylate kinase
LSRPPARLAAIVLLGPTGAGKTPLGRELEAHGFRGRACFHFDFGDELRAAARSSGPIGELGDDARRTIRRSLETGALLEDEDFAIALSLLRDYVQRRHIGPDGELVLNGLPRHAGQARMLEPEVEVGMVIVLDASAETIRERLTFDPGGDRKGRPDDGADDVRRKLLIYRSRTEPLAAYYEARGTRLLRISVTARETAAEMRRRLEVLA